MDDHTRRLGIRARGSLRSTARWILATAILSGSGTTFAYVGEGFISIPGSPGHYRGRDHRDWIRAEASDWPGRTAMTRRLSSGSGDPLAGDKLFFGGPAGARPGGGGMLVVTLSKSNPDFAQLMDRCLKQTAVPELVFAESSDRARPPLELGQRPAEFPAFWEYKLKEVVVSDCPVVEGAIEQAFVLTFKDVEWLNYDAKRSLTTKIVVRPEDLPNVQPAEPSSTKKVKSFLVTWLGLATDAAEDQCPVMNGKPSEAEIYRYLSPEEVTKERVKNGEKGPTPGMQTEMRGPHKLNAVVLPGIVPDPGIHEPQSRLALGINLDGDDGGGPPPKGIRKHKNYISPDGRPGIDNQYYTVMGCVPGFRGKKGYANQTPNARRADGNITTIVEISGIDDERNDDSVEVAIIHSMDKPIRDNAGKTFIANYTFRPTVDPNFALYSSRVRGRIVEGVVVTDPVPKFELTPGQGPLMTLSKARMRFEFLPDGSVKGVLAGYMDWRKILPAGGYGEGLFGFNTPALYYAFKRNADGLQDPVTGEFNGISTVYEIDGVPAFLTSGPPTPLKIAQARPSVEKSR